MEETKYILQDTKEQNIETISDSTLLAESLEMLILICKKTVMVT